MNPTELKAAIEAKAMAFEAALNNQRPYLELQELYKELKELKYQQVQVELKEFLAEKVE